MVATRDDLTTLDWAGAGIIIVGMEKGTGIGGHRPTRPLAGWATAYAVLDKADRAIMVPDRDDQVFSAASQLGAIDWRAYLSHGTWNDTHSSRIVGVPTMLEWVNTAAHPLAKTHRKLGWWTAGHLWDPADPASWELYAPARPGAGMDAFRPSSGPRMQPTPAELARADHFWHVGRDLQKAGRSLGFSVQGKMALSPCKKRIVGAWVASSAVCELPVNPLATADIVELLKARRFDASACGRCRCPAGVCTRDLEKATYVRDGTGFLPRHQRQSDVDPEQVRAEYDAIVDTIVERWGVDPATARGYVDAFLTSVSRSSDAAPTP